MTRYLDSQEDSTLIFELSKDMSHTRLENTREIQKDKMEVFPPKGLKEPAEQMSQSEHAMSFKRQDDKRASEYE